jgi:hypothetical protein
MEYVQAIQNRATQTAAVVNQYLPLMGIGSVSASELLTQSNELGRLTPV